MPRLTVLPKPLSGGLAGVGAGAQAFATLNSNEEVNFAQNSVVRANGYLNMFAGQDQFRSDIQVSAKADIFNKTAIAINAGLNADALVNRDAAKYRCRLRGAICPANESACHERQSECLW